MHCVLGYLNRRKVKRTWRNPQALRAMHRAWSCKHLDKWDIVCRWSHSMDAGREKAAEVSPSTLFLKGSLTVWRVHWGWLCVGHWALPGAPLQQKWDPQGTTWSRGCLKNRTLPLTASSIDNKWYWLPTENLNVYMNSKGVTASSLCMTEFWQISASFCSRGHCFGKLNL